VRPEITSRVDDSRNAIRASMLYAMLGRQLSGGGARRSQRNARDNGQCEDTSGPAPNVSPDRKPSVAAAPLRNRQRLGIIIR
jgi:hypothetical protein